MNLKAEQRGEENEDPECAGQLTGRKMLRGVRGQGWSFNQRRTERITEVGRGGEEGGGREATKGERGGDRV